MPIQPRNSRRIEYGKRRPRELERVLMHRQRQRERIRKHRKPPGQSMLLATGLVLACCFPGTPFAMSAAPRAPNQWALRAEQLFEQQKFAEAQAAAEASLRADRNQPEAHLVLAMIATNNGRLADARQHFERAAELQPGNARVLGYLAAAYFQEGRLKQAESAFRRVLSLDGRNLAAHYNLGLLLLQAGSASEAERHFRFVRDADASDLPSRVGALECQLVRKDSRGIKESSAELDALLSPRDPERLRVAAVLDRYGAWPLAITILERVPADVPHAGNARYDLALALFRAGQPDRAAGVLRSIPESAEANNLLGRVEEARGSLQAAGTAFTRAATLKPRNEDYRLDHASFQLQHEDPQAALDAFTAAAAEFPASWRIRLGLGAAQYLAGKPQQAAETLLGVASLQPRAQLTYSLLGSLYDMAGSAQDRIAAALATYLEGKPADGAAYCAYGKILASRARTGGSGGYGPAREILRKAIALAPGLADSYVQLAAIELEEGRTEESRNLLRRAIRMDPRAPEPHYRLASLYQRLGLRSEAAAEAALFTQLKAAQTAGMRAAAGAQLRRSTPSRDDP